jgi:hypothetical protein
MWISRRLVSLGWVAAICPDERDLVSQFRSGHLRLMRVCALRDLSLERSTRFAARLRALRDRSLGRFTRFCCVGIFGFGLFGTLRGVPRSFLISWTVAFLQLSVLLVLAPLLQGVRT